MRRTSYGHMNCSIAAALDIVGEPWTFLIVRDALYGVRRFDDFQANLGIARNVLTARLKRLVEAGVFRRVAYQQRPLRYEYRLSEKARRCFPSSSGSRSGATASAPPPRTAGRWSWRTPPTAIASSRRWSTCVPAASST